jgi:hypothetical protein
MFLNCGLNLYQFNYFNYQISMTKSMTDNKEFVSLPCFIIVKLIWCTMALIFSCIVLQFFNCTHPCCLIKSTVENVVWWTGILFPFYQPTSFSCLDSSTWSDCSRQRPGLLKLDARHEVMMKTCTNTGVTLFFS